MTTLPQTTPMRLPRPMAPQHLAMPGANGQPAHFQPPTAGGASLSAADIWRVIRSNLWLILITVLVFGVAGFFVNMFLAARFARFTSTAQIRVQTESEIPRISQQQQLNFDPPPQNIDLEQQTQAASLTSRYFIGSILEDPQSQIRQTTWLKKYGNDIEDAKEDLLNKLDVSPKSGTRIILVGMATPIPRESQMIVEDIVSRHIAIRREKTHAAQIQKSQDLAKLTERYENTLSDLRSQLARLARELGAENSGTGEGISGLDMQLQGLMQKQTEFVKDLNEAQMKVDTFLKEVKAGLVPKEVQEYVNRDSGQNYNPIQNQIDQIVAALESEKARYGINSPRVQQLQAQLDSLQGRQAEHDNEKREQGIAVIKTDLDFALETAKKSLGEIKEQVDSLNKRSAVVAAKRNEFHVLQDQEKSTREELEKVQDEKNKLDLFIQQNNWATAELAMPADLPDKPSFPKLPITLSLAIGLGLMLSLGIAFFRELTDTSVRSPRDIARVGQLNLLGLIPHEADDPEAAGSRLPLAIYEAPQSIIAEQFRQVRTRLQHSASLDTMRSLLVTGTSPGDGKTTVACNLAAGLALNGRRILLVDANFRRPQVHVIFNLPNEIGFGDVLNSLDVFDEAVRETEVPNLSIVTSGVKPSNPTELLESQLLIDFIERALEEYDHVIFDSGPLLIVSETVALAPRVDGVVTVVRAQGNSRGMLQRMRDQLKQLKAEHLGVILNAVRSQSGGYYAPMIKTYYAYHDR